MRSGRSPLAHRIRAATGARRAGDRARRVLAVVGGILGLAVAAVAAAQAPGSPLLPGNPSFATPPAPAVENLRALEGCWTGEAPHGFEATASYRLASNGTALVEYLRSEQNRFYSATVYYLVGETPMAHHFCAFGSQIRMRAVSTADPGMLRFEFLDATNLADREQPHMSDVTFTFRDPDRFESAWSVVFDGRHHVKTWKFRRAAGEDCP